MLEPAQLLGVGQGGDLEDFAQARLVELDSGLAGGFSQLLRIVDVLLGELEDVRQAAANVLE